MNKSFKKWISSSGRASRLEFFIISVISLTVLIFITALFIKLFQNFQNENIRQIYTKDYIERSIYTAIVELSATGELNTTAHSLYQDLEAITLPNLIRAALTYILFLPFAIVWVTGAIRRLHDIGAFGWWTLITLAPIWLLFDNWMIVFPLLFLFFKKGQAFHNKYGPNPLNPKAPIPLETPKESEKLAKFERDFLIIVERVKIHINSYWNFLLKKTRNKD